MINTSSFIHIPIAVYNEIQYWLEEDNKLQAISALRNCQVNINEGKDKLYLKECKATIDWIQANPDSVLINNVVVLVPTTVAY